MLRMLCGSYALTWEYRAVQRQSALTLRSGQPVPSILGDFGRFGTVLGNFAHTTWYNFGLGLLVRLGFMSGVILPIRFVHLT